MIGSNDSHQMNLDIRWFNFIKNNNKTIEGRIYDEKRKKYKINDIIKFTNNTNSEVIERKISNLEIFTNQETFMDVINADNYKKLIPDAETIEDAVKVYENIPTYKDKAKKYGIILIQFKYVFLISVSDGFLKLRRSWI